MNMRLIGTGVLGLALIGGGTAWYMQANRAPAITYTTSPVDHGQIQAKVTATGTLSALVTVQVGSQVSGRISQLLVDYNAPVKKGQVLARLDPLMLQAALAQAQANNVAAVSNLTKARVQAGETARQLDRSRQLAARQLIAQADLDTAQANADSARAQVAAAEAGVAQAGAQVNQAKLNLTYATIVSPIDGTVISRSVDVGQTVAASLQAPELFKIAQDLRKEQVNVSVSEADVGKLKAGMPAEFTVAAYPNEKFRGTVRQVRNAATTNQNVVTYDAVIDVANPDLKLKPGMTANVTFVYADRPNALRVPNAALRFTPPLEALGERRRKKDGEANATGAATPNGDKRREMAGETGDRPRRERLANDPEHRRVWVLDGEKVRPVRVRVGITDGSFTEVVNVKGELNDGDAVITDSSASNGGQGARQGGGNRGGMRVRGMF